MLLRKELGVLRFWWMFILLIQTLAMAMTAMTSFLDSDPLTVEQHQENLSSILIFAVVIGFGSVATAFGHEREHDTQRFLDGLPISPARVFFTKTLAAYLTVIGWYSIDLCTSLLGGVLSQTSLNPHLPTSYLLGLYLLSALHGFAVVGVGSVLAFAGRWYASLVGLLIWFGLWIRLQESWWASLFDGMELLSPELEGLRIKSLAWTPLLGHVGVGAVGLLLGFVLYAGREGWLSRWIQLAMKIKLVRWSVKLAPAAALATWVAVLLMVKEQEESSGDTQSRDDKDAVASAAGESSGKEWALFQRHETRDCEFLFRATQRQDAEQLWSVADQVCDEALEAFGGQGRWKGRLIVDLSAPVASHAAAQTDWTKIRFPLDGRLPPDARPHVLRHEVTHVIIEQLSDGQARKHFNAMRAFHEGMATHVETRGAHSDYAREERKRHHQAAALAWSRGPVPLDELLMADDLGRRRDEFLVYPLGLVWVESLIEIGGNEMPALLLQTLRAKPPKPGREGREVWQHLFAQTGHSWERAEAIYENRMAELVKQHQKLIDSLPRLTAQVKKNAGNVLLIPSPNAAPAPGFSLICIVKPRFGLLPQRERLELTPEGQFRLTDELQAKGRLLYMLGWRHEDERMQVFEPWTELTLPSSP